jgi:hypothetical protein
MKRYFLALCLSLCIPAQTAFAIPMLSADGSSLKGVDVNGVLYDISFGDGILSEVYPASLVDSPGWTELVFEVAEATAAAINSLPFPVLNTDFRGCEESTGIPGFIGPDVCILGIPTHMAGTDTYGFENLLGVNPHYPPGPAFFEPFEVAYQVPLSLLGFLDTGTEPGLAPLATLATFRLASVPNPSSLSILVLGFIALILRRSRGSGNKKYLG